MVVWWCFCGVAQCCRQVLGRSVLVKCCRNVAKKCCRDMLECGGVFVFLWWLFLCFCVVVLWFVVMFLWWCGGVFVFLW